MSSRPPKPPYVTAAPRHKSRKKQTHEPGLKGALDAASRLTRIAPTPEHFQQFSAEVRAARNDRGAAILLAAYVENILQQSLIRVFRLSDARQSDLFGFERPLGDFSGKIWVAHAMGLFGPQTRSNLDIIRVIRNTFAHAMIPISFETTQIASVCEHLVGERFDGLIGRPKFQEACYATTEALIVQSQSAWTGVAPTALRVPLPDNLEIWTRPKALP